MSRMENLPDHRALLCMMDAMIELFSHSFDMVPKRIILDIDDTCDTVHGGQQLAFFSAHHNAPTSKGPRRTGP